MKIKMDKVYGDYNRQASPKICLNDYFQQYSELLKDFTCHEIGNSNKEKIFQVMGTELTDARAQLITHYCSIDNLTLPVESTINKKKHDGDSCESFFDNTQLETVNVLKEIYKKPLINKQKSQNGIPIEYEKSKSADKTVIPRGDFLVYVRVYEPFTYNIHPLNKFKQHYSNLRLKNIITILGSQTLVELRDKIMCSSDLSISTEISKNPNRRSELMAKDVYKSGFFYIENTFYNDTRDSNNIDYSSVIIKWAESRDIGPFTTAKMEDTYVNSLHVRFGFPWVYQHQGCCEHIIVLTDARLVTEDDLASSAYPRIERIRPLSGKNCIMCGILNVRWITTEHDRIPHDTSYFCDRCFKSYNYVNGKKVGNFKAYNYPCIPELMFQKKSVENSNR